MGKKGTGHADLDDIFDTIARPRTADPPVSEQRRPSMHGGANGGARAAGTTAGCVASPARPHTASTGSTAAAAGGNAFQNAFQRRADEELGTTPAGPSAGASAKASAKRKRPSGPDERNDRPAEHEQTIAAPVRARGEIKRAERAVPTWPLEISDATLAKAADGALLKLARSVRPYAGGGAGGTPPTLGSSTALVLLGGWQLAPAGAARKLSLDALLLQLSPFAPFHAHALSFWTAATTVAGGGGGDDGGKAVDMLALELNASAASALLLAAAERLAGRQLGPLASSTQSGVQGGSGGLKLVEAARALLRTQPLLVIGDSCDGLCAQARIALAAAATEPRTAALARAILRGGAAGSSPALVRLAVSACSTAEARALLALAAETAATAKGADADAMGGQLERLCARHRQGKALACVGVAMAPVPSKGSVLLPACSLALAYCGRVTGRPLPVVQALALLDLLDAHDWEATGNNRNPSGRKDGIQVDGSFSLGLGTSRLPPAAAACPGGVLAGSAPFSTPCTFREGVGLQRGEAVRKRYSALWAAAMALLASVDAEYVPTSIGFNRNFRGSPHRDEKDSGPQVATALSAALRGGRGYEGGALRVYGPHGAVDVDTQNSWCRFDGRYRHEVMPFNALAGKGKGKGEQLEGVRYSVIYYQLSPPFAVDMGTVLPPGS